MTIWLRAETRKHERRTPLIPAHAEALRAHGFHVYVEASKNRIYTDHDYAAAGCQTVPAGSWREAPAACYILGLKELPEEPFVLTHRHIYYADAFERRHMYGLLARFKAGGGMVYDYEYLINSQNQPVASMSYWAGYCGAAIALMIHKGKKSIPEFFPGKMELDLHLERHINKWKRKPRALVIGAGGVAGKAVLGLLEKYQIQAITWYKSHTQEQESAHQILDFDLVFNCAALRQKTQAFLTNESFLGSKSRTLIQDIGCFLGSIFGNPLPVYDRHTTFARPVQSVTPNVDLIAIDNLPAFLPKESSDAFSTMLFPHLLQLLHNPGIACTPWKQAEKRYNAALRECPCE